MPPESRNSVGPLHSSPPSTGVSNPDRMTDTEKAEFILGRGVDPDHMSDSQKATVDSLNKALIEWTNRARGCANDGAVTLSKPSSAQRIRSRATVSSSKGGKKVRSGKYGKSLDRKAKKLVKEENTRLVETYGDKDNRAESLLDKYKSLVWTLHARAFNAASDADVEDRQQGLTNLKLFLSHGGKLHSTGKDLKLERTIAKIPKNVLKNASGDVSTMDFAVAEHLGVGVADHVQGGRKLPLLSFHGFKATRSWFGRGKQSKAYRENLRAITASAFLLGGVGKALRVKRLLSQIDSQGGGPEVGGKKEDMVKRVLENLATHSDPDALIDDLEFELTRHHILKGVRKSRHDDAKRLYPEIREKLRKLGEDPNRATIIENMKCMIGEQIKGNQNIKGYGLDNPENLLRDLRFITEENPIATFMERHPEDPGAARYAVAIWVNLMTPADGGDRAQFKNLADKISREQSVEDQDKTYLDAVHTFGLLIDKSRKSDQSDQSDNSDQSDKVKISAETQSALLLSCLSYPDKPSEWHLAKLDGGQGKQADLHIDEELKFNEDGDVSEDEYFNPGSDKEKKIDIDLPKFSLPDDPSERGPEKHIVMHFLHDVNPDIDGNSGDNDPPNTEEQKKDV